jgi:hypothetical protein
LLARGLDDYDKGQANISSTASCGKPAHLIGNGCVAMDDVATRTSTTAATYGKRIAGTQDCAFISQKLPAILAILHSFIQPL